jgi:hypothetical protein
MTKYNRLVTMSSYQCTNCTYTTYMCSALCFITAIYNVQIGYNVFLSVLGSNPGKVQTAADEAAAQVTAKNN